jgi:hypothetical protein
MASIRAIYEMSAQEKFGRNFKRSLFTKVLPAISLSSPSKTHRHVLEKK